MIAGIGCQVLVQLVIMSLQYVAGGAILAALMPNIFTPVTGDAHQCRRLHRHYPYRRYVVGQPV
jgi:hypothetical protein